MDLTYSVLHVNQEGILETNPWLSNLKYFCLSKSLLVSFTYLIWFKYKITESTEVG